MQVDRFKFKIVKIEWKQSLLTNKIEKHESSVRKASFHRKDTYTNQTEHMGTNF